MASEEKGSAAVYAPWSTFKSALDKFAQGVPNQIDRSVFIGMAWSVQSQVLSGLKFLGLIDAKGKPTPALHKLATLDEGARKEALKVILTSRYEDLVALDLTKATPAQLEKQMSDSYRVGGATRAKAVRFFLSAADYAGVPLSSYLKPKGVANGGTGAGASSRKRRAPQRPKPPQDPGVIQPPPPNGATRIVSLKSGGTLTLTASIDVLRLIPADRTFVFELIDKLEEYEAQNPRDVEEPEDGQEE